MLDTRSIDSTALAILGFDPEMRRYNPAQKRDPNGEWGDGIPGPGVPDLVDFDPISSAEGTFGELLLSVDKVGDVRLSFQEHGKDRVVDLSSDDLEGLRHALTSLADERDDAMADDSLSHGEIYAEDEFGPDGAHRVELYGSGVIAVVFGGGDPDDDDPYTLHLDPPHDADPDNPDDEDSDDVQAVIDAMDDVFNELDTDPSRSTPGGGRVEARAEKPYGDVQYADPGYQDDGKARYPLDSEEHCRAAWSYINQAGNAAKYTAGQLARIRARIKAAAKQYGIEISDDGRSFQPEDHPRAPKGSDTGGQFAKAAGSAKKSAAATVKAHGSHPRKPGSHPPRKPDDGTLSYDPDSDHGTGYDSKNGDPRVHDLQESLNRLGVKDSAGRPLKKDGKLGPKTTSAVKKLQKLLGVEPDGKVTPALFAQIKAMKSLPAQKRSDAMGVCIRSFGFEPDERSRAGDGRTLEGYAAVFNSPARIRDLNGDFEETILPGAFKRTLSERTPILQWDHGKDPRIGTAPIGDIEELREDDHGLYVRARLYDHPDIERIRMAIAGRSVKGMSFRFGVPKGGDDWPTRDQRTIRDLDAYELGPVAFPAYDTTSVSVRSLLVQLDPDEHRSLIRELAAELRLAVDLSDLTGASDARRADRGDLDLQPGSGDRSALPPEIRRLEAEALHALGVL